MKGVVMAGGKGNRLYPLTAGVSKHLLPIYDKPMVFYPLSVLMLAGVRDILLVCNPCDLDNYKRLLGSGANYGINLFYITQLEPRGIAEAFILGADFIGTDCVCLILGDNLFYGQAILYPCLFSRVRTNSEASIIRSGVPASNQVIPRPSISTLNSPLSK